MDELIDTTFASFALQQNLPLDEIAQGVEARELPESRSQSPEWFAHQASEDDLLALAPELREEFAAADGDLVALYGGSDRLSPAGSNDAPQESGHAQDDEAVPTAQILRVDLLKEISALED